VEEGQTMQWSKEKKDKRANNNLQNITKKIKDRKTRAPVTTGGELRCSGRVAVPALLVIPGVVLLLS